MKTTVDNFGIIPFKERARLRDKKIRSMYKLGLSMNQICMELNVSKTTVFFAVNGRSKKKK